MTSNHAPLPLSWPSLTGCGYGLGFSVVLDPEQTQFRASRGTFGWIGHLGTYFFVDPEKELIGIFMTQALPIPRLVFEEFHTLAMKLAE
jgi:CubicO group peptidase (beta-lactamase class C family)